MDLAGTKQNKMVEKAIPQDSTLHRWPHHQRDKGKMASKSPLLTTHGEREQKEKSNAATKLL